MDSSTGILAYLIASSAENYWRETLRHRRCAEDGNFRGTVWLGKGFNATRDRIAVPKRIRAGHSPALR